MENFRRKLAKFMYGRYGMDHMSKFIIYITFVLLLFTLFTNSSILYFIALIGLLYTYYRAFSKNISKRYHENEVYLKVKYKVLGRFNKFIFRCKDRKTHVIFKCPSCSQKIRVPRGKGNISIKCPKCRIEFTKRT